MVSNQPFQPGSECEKARLVALARAFDSRTQWLISRLIREKLTDLAAPSFLEVGAGSGSIALWFRDTFSHSVTALDVDVSLLSDNRERIEVIRDDICEFDRPASFDIVHSRFLLDLLDQPATALAAMHRAVRPGGWLVIEEFDDLNFDRAIGSRHACELHAAVVAAKQEIWSRLGKPNYLGRDVFEMVQRLPLDDLEAQFGGAIRRAGGSDGEVWRLTVEALRAELLDTHRITAAMHNEYLGILRSDRGFHYFSPTTVAVLARRAARS